MPRKVMKIVSFKVKAIRGDGSEKFKEITLQYHGQNYGKGAFGVVRAAQLMETGEKVAVKISRTHPIRMEVKYLKELKHCNIINMLYHFQKETRSGTVDCIVMETMPTTLRKVLEASHVIPVLEGKVYMYQILRGLAYMHAKGICHRDLKPENVLLDHRTGIVKLCDFGNSARLSPHSNNPRAGTVLYLAPEMLFNYTNYTKIVDMWSAGCIFVEVLKGGEILFGKAKTEIELLTIMIDYFGTPTENQFSALQLPDRIAALPKKEAKPWSEIIRPYPISDDAISLCSSLLCYSPSCRLPAHQALANKFFDELRSPESKFLGNDNPLPPLFNFQSDELGYSYDLLPFHKRSKNSHSTASDGANHTRILDQNIGGEDNMLLRAYRMFQTILTILRWLFRELRNVLF